MLTSSNKKAPARERALEAALRLFSTKGYLGTTTREIAGEAGVSEVTLFRHFHSKEELFGEAINTYSFLPALKGILPTLEGKNYEAALKEIAMKFFERAYERKDFIRIMFSELQHYPEKAKAIHRSFLDELARTLAAYLKQMHNKGVLRALDPELSARAFLGMFFAFFCTKEIFRVKGVEGVEKEAVIEEFVNIFARGTKKK